MEHKGPFKVETMKAKNDSVVKSLALMRIGGGNVHVEHRPQGSSSENVLAGDQNDRREFWVKLQEQIARHTANPTLKVY